MNLAFALLAAVGATLIIVCSTVFKPVQRLWPALFRCAQCSGWWVGVAVGASGIAPVTGHGWLLDAIFFGAANSGASFFAYALLLTMLGAPDEDSRE